MLFNYKVTATCSGCKFELLYSMEKGDAKHYNIHTIFSNKERLTAFRFVLRVTLCSCFSICILPSSTIFRSIEEFETKKYFKYHRRANIIQSVPGKNISDLLFLWISRSKREFPQRQVDKCSHLITFISLMRCSH